MALPLKILLALIGVLAATAAGAVLWAVFLFDPNDYRDDVARVASDNTGRELRIEGPLELSLFPWFGATVQGVQLANAEGFGPEPMLEVGELSARVELWPLLTQRQVRIGDVALREVRLRLASEGERNNWQDLGQGEEEPAPEEDTGSASEPPAEDTTQQEPLQWGVESLTLEDIRIEYLADGELTSVELERLETGPVQPGAPSTLLLELRSELADGTRMDTQLRSNWLFTPEGPRLEFDETLLEAVLEGRAIPGGEQALTLRTAGAYDGAAQTLKLPQLALDAGELKATGDIDFRLGDTPGGSASLKTEPFSAPALLASLGLPFGQGGSAGPSALDLAFTLGPDGLRTQRLQGQLDGAPLRGELALTNFAQPRINADIDLERLTLAHWLPADSEGEKQSDEAGPGPLEQELPLELLDALYMDARVRIGELVSQGPTARDVLWTARARPGQGFEQQLTLAAFGGRLKADNSVRPGQDAPRTALKLNLEAIGLGELLQGTVGEQWISGLTQLTLDLAGRGDTPRALLASAAGNARYRIEDGSVRGLSVLDLINGALARLEGGNAADGGPTRFERIAGELVFEGGFVRMRGLDASNELLALNGRGGLNLESLRWDLSLEPVLKDHPSVRQRERLAKLIGLPIPIKVSGPLMAPKFEVDLEGALKAKAKARLEEEKDELRGKARDKVEEKLKEELGDELGENLGRSLGNLLGIGGRKTPTPQPTSTPVPTPTPAPSPQAGAS